MSKSKKTANVVTPEFRMSYPSLLTPKLNGLSGKTEYSVVALFPKNADLSALKAEAFRAASAKWGADQTKWPTNLRSPFRDQGEREKTGDDGKPALPPGHEKGAVFINLKSNVKPGVVDANVQPIIEAGEIYGGCYAVASVQAFAYDKKGNRGISFGLRNIQKTRDGESFGMARVDPEDEFQPVSGGDDSAATAGSIFG